MSDENTALLVMQDHLPVMEVSSAMTRYTMLNSFIGSIMREGTDYGKIPGAGDKSVLLKPGAEKLSMFFGLAPTFEQVRTVEDWTGKDYNGEPFFYYLIKCRLSRNGQIVAEGDGSCNSRESKYRYRGGERVCPSCGKPTLIKGKDEYEKDPRFKGGWLCFAKKGGCGEKFVKTDPAITEQQVGRVLNPDPADQVNTILKMAEKRALIAATLIAVNASDYFTQDIEDLPGFGDVVEANFRVVPQDERPTAAAKPAAAPSRPIVTAPTPKPATDSRPMPRDMAESYKQGAQDGAANPAIVKSGPAPEPLTKLTPNMVYDASGGVDAKHEAIVDGGWDALEGDLQRRVNDIRQRVFAHADDAEWKMDAANDDKTKRVNGAFGIAWKVADERRAIRQELFQREVTGYTVGEADAVLSWIAVHKEGDDWLPSAQSLEDGKTILASLSAQVAQTEAPTA